MRKKTLFISGYPYARETYRKTFDFAQHEGLSVRYILPRSWPIKNGEIVFRPEKNERTSLVPTWSSHSHYPIIGGLFKGLMPTLPFVLFRYGKRGDVLFTALEPTLFSALYSGFWAKARGMRHVLFTWENIPYEHKHGRTGLWFKKCTVTLNRWFSDAIVCGNEQANEIMASYGFKHRAVIPISGIDRERFRPRERPDSYQGVDLNGVTTLSYAGALDDRKGITYLLDALEEVLQKQKIHLFLAGAGPLRDKIAERIAGSEMKDRVTLLPWLSPTELSELFSATDIFVYPSTTRGGWAEQFGYVVAESLASGVPAIVSTSGSLPWVVRNGKTGLVVQERSVDALVVAIENLIMHPQKRQEMGVAGAQDTSARFGYHAVAEKYMLFIQSLA